MPRGSYELEHAHDGRLHVGLNNSGSDLDVPCMTRPLSSWLPSPLARSSLLSHQVGQLRLSPTAPYPGKCFDVKEMIKDWREQQRLKLVKGERNE